MACQTQAAGLAGAAVASNARRVESASDAMKHLRALLPLLALLLSGCPQDISGIEDPSLDGGEGRDGQVIPWLPSDGGGPIDPVEKDGGTQPPPDAGQGSDAGTVSNDLKWGTMTFPSTVSLYDIHGSAPDNVYAVGNSGYVFRYDGKEWKQVFKDTVNATLRSVWVSPAGGVFIAGGNYPVWCTGGCNQELNYKTTTIATCGLVVACGRGDTVWLLGNKQNNELCGYRFNGTGWDDALTLPAAQGIDVRGCFVADDDALVLTSQWRILRYSEGTTEEETTDLGSQEMFGVVLNTIHGAGGVMYAAGTDNRILKREPGGTWKHVFMPGNTGDEFRELTGVGALELFAGGSPSTTANMFARVEASGWRFMKPGPRMDVWGMWAASDGLVFAAGIEFSGSQGVILRGVR